MGKMRAPFPEYTCVPPMPYRINASLGPTFRYIRAMTTMIIKSPRTSDPAMTNTSIGNPNIKTSPFDPSGLFAACFSPTNSSLRELFPPFYVGDSLLIPLDHHFRAPLDCFAVIAARSRATTCPTERENDFSSAVFANPHTDGSQRPFHSMVFCAHRRIVRLHQLHHELEDHAAREQPRDHRNPERHHGQKMRMPRQQVTRAAKPGQKGHDG